jgi:glycosyltransferase involved in cell wall biosynthesis
MYVAPILASAGRLIILTTCLKNYKYLNRFFRRNYHYVPVPLTIPYYRKRYNEMKGNPLRVICITHPTYKRFPYIELFKVLKKLRNDGYKIILRVYFSKIRSTYSDYASFVKRVASNIKKLDIADTVKLHVLNLSEEEKYKVLADNDVFLYPALEEVAVDPPLTVLEAMATGCCVISTSVQSCSLILNHSRGILFSPRNFETEIDEALRRIIDEPRLIPLYGFAARMYIRFFHDREKVSKHIAEIIHDFAI